MATLTEFLTARLDEDEEVARKATVGPWATQTMAGNLVYGGDTMFVAQTSADTVMDERVLDDALHIERFDPVRVLAEVEAKRRIVGAVDDKGPCLDRYLGADDCDHPGCVLGRATLRLLARPYADHPDYDEGWRV